jgi:small subunit ribosomal protein S9
MAKAPTVYYATGKRKTSAARIFMQSGSGKVQVNGKDLKDFTLSETGRTLVLSPFVVAEVRDQYDVRATVAGGGPSAQLDAIKHGIARALVVANAEKNRPLLKKAGFLTRDDRMVERKKYGLHKARKRPQFSKR